MEKIKEKIRNAMLKFGFVQWGFFKLTMILLGVILCIYFYNFFFKYIEIVWIVFAIGMIYNLYLFFKKTDENDKGEKIDE